MDGIPDKNTIATHLLAGGAMAAAGLMQLGTQLLLAVQISPRKTAGAFIVSSISGGIVSIVCQDYFHWDSFISGAAGAASGMFPAALFVMAFSRKALEKAGLKPDDLMDMARAQAGEGVKKDD